VKNSNYDEIILIQKDDHIFIPTSNTMFVSQIRQLHNHKKCFCHQFCNFIIVFCLQLWPVGNKSYDGCLFVAMKS